MVAAPSQRGPHGAVRFADRHGRLRTALGEATLAELRIVRTPLRTELHAVVRHAATPDPTGEPTNPVGMDKGLTNRLARCDGTYVKARTDRRHDSPPLPASPRPGEERIPNACEEAGRARQGVA